MNKSEKLLPPKGKESETRHKLQREDCLSKAGVNGMVAKGMGSLEDGTLPSRAKGPGERSSM